SLDGVNQLICLSGGQLLAAGHPQLDGAADHFIVYTAAAVFAARVLEDLLAGKRFGGLPGPLEFFLRFLVAVTRVISRLLMRQLLPVLTIGKYVDHLVPIRLAQRLGVLFTMLDERAARQNSLSVRVGEVRFIPVTARLPIADDAVIR